MAVTLTCPHCGCSPKLPPNMPSVIVCPYCHKPRANPDVPGGNKAWLPAPVGEPIGQIEAVKDVSDGLELTVKLRPEYFKQLRVKDLDDFVSHVDRMAGIARQHIGEELDKEKVGGTAVGWGEYDGGLSD